MNISIKDVDLSLVDAMIRPVFEGDTCGCNTLKLAVDSGSFSGKDGEVFYVTENRDGLKYKILVGMGKMEDFNGEVFRNAIAKGVKKCKDLKIKSFAIKFIDTDKLCVGFRTTAITEACGLALYSFDKYKTDSKEYNPEVFITGVPEDKKKKATFKLEQALNVVHGVNLTRDLVNEPSNVIYPESLANETVKIGKEAGFEVEIIDEAKCSELGMEAFLSVGRGSDNKPKLIVMRYMGNPENKDIYGLVGKGITYDTGGYSLKPSNSMKDMKSDMGGAGSVIGTMYALAKNKIRKNVVAVVAACENSISGNAYKPGDIIGSMAGKTIEILNTDAEGRLTLADAVTYIIEKENVSNVIDVATLTGAAVVALGETTTAVVSNDDELYADLIEASERTGEKFWRLPGFDDYKKLIKGTVSDLKNIGGKNAGTITAGLFIKEFVQDKPWLHLDIAGTAWRENPTSDYIVAGGTGAPVRTLYKLICGKCGCKH